MKKLILVLTISVFGFNTALMADVIKVGFGLSLPPYVIKASLSGMEFDVIKEALKRSGHTMEPVFFAAGKETGGGLHGFSSNEVIRYQNFAISLQKNALSISSVEDMKGKRIVAFANAHKYLGSSYARLTKRNKDYTELSSQVEQIKLFLSEKKDILISDKNIFSHTSKGIKGMEGILEQVTFHEIFKPSKYGVVFKNKEVRDAFNISLKSMRDDGSYKEILASY